MLDTIQNALQPDDQPRIDATPQEIATIIRNARRRRVIQYLDRHPRADRGELADHLTTFETPDPERRDTQVRKAIYVALYQDHLHKLETADVIEYDHDRGTIRPGPSHAAYLDLVETLEHAAIPPEEVHDDD